MRKGMTRCMTEWTCDTCQGGNPTAESGVVPEQGRLVSILEGGYHVRSQPSGVTRSGNAYSKGPHSGPHSGALASSKFSVCGAVRIV